MGVNEGTPPPRPAHSTSSGRPISVSPRNTPQLPPIHIRVNMSPNCGGRNIDVTEQQVCGLFWSQPLNGQGGPPDGSRDRHPDVHRKVVIRQRNPDRRATMTSSAGGRYRWRQPYRAASAPIFATPAPPATDTLAHVKAPDTQSVREPLLVGLSRQRLLLGALEDLDQAPALGRREGAGLHQRHPVADAS